MDIRLPSPVTHIPLHPGNKAGIQLYIKRDDLIHPVVQGNKWRKVHLLFERLQQENVTGIITFGGPFSNYLHAVAAAGPVFGLQTVAVVRGIASDLHNPTLDDARQYGMQLFPVPKKDYDQKTQSAVVQDILRQFPDYVVIPEGGATIEGVNGTAAIVEEVKSQIQFDENHLFMAVPAGTGCTATGIIAGMAGQGQTLIFPAAQYGVSPASITEMLMAAGYPDYQNFTYFKEYIRGKFASPSPEIRTFGEHFETQNGIPIDPIYTPRMLFGIYDLLEKGYFPEGSTIVAIHTGGIQGWRGIDKK